MVRGSSAGECISSPPHVLPLNRCVWISEKKPPLSMTLVLIMLPIWLRVHTVTQSAVPVGFGTLAPLFAEYFALIRLTQRRCLMCAKCSPSSLNSYLQMQLRTLRRLHLSLSFYCSCNHFAWFGCQLVGSWT